MTVDSSGAPLRVVLVGHVDHGKSTLTGRLLADSGALPVGKLDAVRASCERRGVPFEHAFLLDALQAERDQNVTIDTSHVWLRARERSFVLIDAPGHREFLKNMITGAAQADAAVLLVAADEGIREQSRRHASLLGLLGIKQVVVVVNKLDRVGRDRDAFRVLEADVRKLLGAEGIAPVAVVPVVAREGENVVERGGAQLAWYTGPTVLDALVALEGRAVDAALPLRFVVQDVYRFDERRIVAGRIEAGELRAGDRVRFVPGDKTATIKSIERWGGKAPEVVRAGDVVGVTLVEPIFVERGQIAVSAEQSDVGVSKRIRARIFWMSKRPLDVDKPLKLRLCTREEHVRVVSVERSFDAGTLQRSDGDGAGEGARIDRIGPSEVADVIIEARTPLALDRAADLVCTGRFVLVDGRDVAGGGLVLDVLDSAADAGAGLTQRAVSDDERTARFGHRGAIVAVTDGDRAAALERILFDRGLTVAVASSLDSARALSSAGLVALVAGVDVDDVLAIALPPSATVEAQADVVVGAVREKRGGRAHAA